MAMMMGSGSSANSNAGSVDHVQVVALYEPDTGRIRHLHMVTSLSGAEPASQEEAIAEARTIAARRSPAVEHLAVALSNDAEHGRRPHVIDPKTKAFVPLSDGPESR